jgi:hypothetical protein
MTQTSTEIAQSQEQLYVQASTAAIEAADAYLKEGHHWFPCGFAWVTITPARGKFVTYLKSIGVGDKAYEGGWKIWNPSRNHTQSMEALKVGAEAFAKVLQAAGINCYAASRMD